MMMYLQLYMMIKLPQRISSIISSGIEIIILETVLHNKERWIYVLGYKPPNINSRCVLSYGSYCYE